MIPRRIARPSRARRRFGLGFGVAVALALPVLTGCDPAATPPRPSDCRVAAVGDSLTVGAAPHLGAALARRGCTLAWVDGRESRSTADGVRVIAERARAGQLPPVLIVGLGTNDASRQDAFAGHVDAVLRHAAGRQVVWIELAWAPVRAKLNAVLAQKARQHANLTVMPWDAAYWTHPTWRASDGIHATRTGYAARAEHMAIAAQRVTK